MATKLELELDRGVDDPADVLEQRKAATKLYLDQLNWRVPRWKANSERYNEPDKQHPKKDTY
tara:strand:+ start:434 stop:619 length:186 start_codon:yes stop_codon:yes gene_type:complete